MNATAHDFTDADVEALLTRLDAITSTFELLGRPVEDTAASVLPTPQPIELELEDELPLDQAAAPSEAAPDEQAAKPTTLHASEIKPLAVLPQGTAPIDWSRFSHGPAVPLPVPEKPAASTAAVAPIRKLPWPRAGTVA
jgi:hypothetical protein